MSNKISLISLLVKKKHGRQASYYVNVVDEQSDDDAFDSAKKTRHLDCLDI